MNRLATTGHGDVKRLQDVSPRTWRLRVGDYRVLFVYDTESGELRVRAARSRGSAYRD